MVPHLSPRSLQGHIQGKTGALETFSRVEGRRCKTRSGGEGKGRDRPQSAPRPPARHLPSRPPPHSLGRSGLRPGSQEAASPPSSISPNLLPQESQQKAGPRQKEKTTNMGFLNTSSLMPPWAPSIPSSSHSLSWPGLEFISGQSS